MSSNLFWGNYLVTILTPTSQTENSHCSQSLPDFHCVLYSALITRAPPQIPSRVDLQPRQEYFLNILLCDSHNGLVFSAQMCESGGHFYMEKRLYLWNGSWIARVSALQDFSLNIRLLSNRHRTDIMCCLDTGAPALMDSPPLFISININITLLQHAQVLQSLSASSRHLICFYWVLPWSHSYQ